MLKSASHIKAALLSLTLFLLLGCATQTGPPVASEEIEELTKELQVKAFLFKAKQYGRLLELGVRVLKAIPEQDLGDETTSIYTGIVATQLGDVSRRAFNIYNEKAGVVIANVVKGSPADKAGLREGDIVRKVDGVIIEDAADLIRSFRDAPHKTLSIEFLKGEWLSTTVFFPERVPTRITFSPVDSQEVNAFATAKNEVMVTYGMLRFVDSDNELSVVIGHEIAHLTKNHLVKSIPSRTAAVILGTIGDVILPGLGGLLAQSAYAPFSRDLEREADFVGLIYAHRAGFDIKEGIEFYERFAIELPASMQRSFLSTHPSSTERLLRVRKMVDDIRRTQLPPI